MSGNPEVEFDPPSVVMVPTEERSLLGSITEILVYVEAESSTTDTGQLAVVWSREARTS